MKRQQAIPYVSFAVNDSLNQMRVDQMPENARLVGWQCGFEPLFVAVWSYLPDVRLDDSEAAEIATDLLSELGWFSGEPSEPDHII